MVSPSEFETRWLPQLQSGVDAVFKYKAGTTKSALHTATADDFASECGFAPIGFNWELLDASPGADSPRAARSQLMQAVANDLGNPSKPWLDVSEAEQFASDFLGLFDPHKCTVVSNRYDGLWNPISGAPVEWAFVGYDDQLIALLLLVARQ